MKIDVYQKWKMNVHYWKLRLIKTNALQVRIYDCQQNELNIILWLCTFCTKFNQYYFFILAFYENKDQNIHFKLLWQMISSVMMFLKLDVLTFLIFDKSALRNSLVINEYWNTIFPWKEYKPISLKSYLMFIKSCSSVKRCGEGFIMI
jgi:hypothetical protein